MDSDWTDLVVAFSLGAIVGLLMGAVLTHIDLRSECESTLPRNEHCTVIAVPESTE